MPRKPWGPGNPLWEWKKKHKSNKKSQHKIYSGVKMARRKRRSIRRYFPRRRSRRGKDRRLSLLKTGAILGIELDAAAKNGGLEGLQANPTNFAKGFIDQNIQKFAGISVFPEMSGVSGWHPEFMLPTYTALIGAWVGSTLANRFGVNREIKKVPFVGRYIKL